MDRAMLQFKKKPLPSTRKCHGRRPYPRSPAKTKARDQRQPLQIPSALSAALWSQSHKQQLLVEEEWLEEVREALGQDDPDLVLSSAFKLKITQTDLATLEEGSWLNDQVINFYMNLVMSRSEQDGGRKVFAFSTFFFPKLSEEGHAAVQRWTRTVDLFLYDIILVPLHLGFHWCLAVIDFEENSVKCYDSMDKSHDDISRLLLLYLKKELEIKNSEDLEVSTWEATSSKSDDIPQQSNDNDCGVFTCKYADYIARGLPLTFTQSDIPNLRMKMIWEILNRRLL